MVELEVRIDGIDAAVARLQGMRADLLGIIEPALLRAGYRTEAEAKEYPPQRPTDYVRTGKLMQSWFTDPVVRSGDELRLMIGTRLAYGPYVRSEERQAWMHRGVWRTDEEVKNEQLGPMVEEMRAALVAAVGGE